MGRILMYGSFVAFIALGGWMYSGQQPAPEWSQPVAMVLVAGILLGYAQKAIEDGDIGRRNVRKSDNPRLFYGLVLAHRILAGLMLVVAAYLTFS